MIMVLIYCDIIGEIDLGNRAALISLSNKVD